MSSILPLQWADKKNSPLLADFITKYGAEYCMTAEEINQLRDAVNEMSVIQQSTFLGAAEPAFTPAGTGRAYWIAVKPGTYANHGSVVVAANEIAFIIRDAAGAFSISKTALDLSTYAKKIDLAPQIYNVTTDAKWSKTSVNSDWNLNVTAGTLYMPNGGYAAIQPYSGNIPNASFVWLSSDAIGTIPFDPNQSTSESTTKAYIQTGDRLAISGKLNLPNFPLLAFITFNIKNVVNGFDVSKEVNNHDWNLFQGKDVSKISVTKISNGVNITTSSVIFILSPAGGLCSVTSFNKDIPGGSGLFLSTNPTTLIAPQSSIGNATASIELYFVVADWSTFYNAVQSIKCPMFGFAIGNSWSTNFEAFKLNKNPIIPDYIIAARKNFSVFEDGTNVILNVVTQATLFDSYGGYRFIPVQTHVVDNQKAVYLSASPTSYVFPNLDLRGTGQFLYFYSEVYNTKTNLKSGSFPIGMVWDNQWNTHHDALMIQSTGTPDNVKEMNGTLPVKNFLKSPISSEIDVFVDKYKRRNQDVTLVHVGDSISTNLNYTTSNTDAMYRPPLMTEQNLPFFIEKKLRWKGQEYRRYDANTLIGGATPVFTEILGGGASTAISSEDATWGYTTPGINFHYPLTKCIDGGTNSGVSYKFPANMRRCNFILHTDLKFASSTAISITEGSGLVQVFNGTAWVEANGYTFSAKELSTIYTDTIGRQYHKDQYQKRIKMRSLTDLTQKTVTISNVGAGRFGYWGIEYSPKEYMFTYINASKGGHNIAALREFETWMVDDFSPDLILQQLCIINEGLTTNCNTTGVVTKSPLDIANNFSNYYDALVAKGYLVMPYILFGGSQMDIVNYTTGEWGFGKHSTYGVVSVFEYLGEIDEMFKSKGVTNVNNFYQYLDLAFRLDELSGTNNIYLAAIEGSGKTGNTFTIDNIHPNDYGTKIAFRLIEKYFNF